MFEKLLSLYNTNMYSHSMWLIVNRSDMDLTYALLLQKNISEQSTNAGSLDDSANIYCGSVVDLSMVKYQKWSVVIIARGSEQQCGLFTNKYKFELFILGQASIRIDQLLNLSFIDMKGIFCLVLRSIFGINVIIVQYQVSVLHSQCRVVKTGVTPDYSRHCRQLTRCQ